MMRNHVTASNRSQSVSAGQSLSSSTFFSNSGNTEARKKSFVGVTLKDAVDHFVDTVRRIKTGPNPSFDGIQNIFVRFRPGSFRSKVVVSIQRQATAFLQDRHPLKHVRLQTTAGRQSLLHHVITPSLEPNP